MADVIGFLRKGFPFLAAGLSVTGPAGNLASNLIGAALKIDKPTLQSVKDTLQSITLTPDQQIALQQAEQQYQAQMTQMGYQHAEDLENIAEQDRASARQRETQIRDYTPRLLGTGIMTAFITAVFMVLSGHAKTDSVIAGTLIGYLSAKAELVLTYYFGSSAGSDRKTEILANQTANGMR